MKTNISGIIILMLITFLVNEASALVPVESLVLGDFKENYNESTSDPLNYVFTREENVKNEKTQFRTEMAQYRGFYEEGKNLANYCKDDRPIRYASEWEKVQMKRSLIALIQYIGLDLMSRAIPTYAKQLEYSRDEFGNLVEGLVGNYCSNNISIISKKELLNNLYLKFDKGSDFKLPGQIQSPFYPEKMNEYIPPKTGMEQEFLYTVKLFQNLCSWNGNPSSAGLIVPILKHSALMAFFTRQMGQKSIEWREKDNSLLLKDDKNTVQVWCENLICRKVDGETLKSKATLSVGGTNIDEDLRRLYCEDFRSEYYRPAEYDERIAKIMNSISFDEENFINSQFISLITGVPDFLLRTKNFSDAEDIFRLSVDNAWDKWAKKMSENYSRELYFEEPLTIELVERSLITNFMKKELRVGFDVNLGEFDRINQDIGKVKMTFKLKVQKSFLKFYKQSFMDQSYADGTKEEIARLKSRFKLQIKDGVQAAKDALIISPWRTDLETLIVEEVTTQIMEKPVKIMNYEGPGDQEIIVEVNYGVFALKYMNHLLQSQKALQKTKPSP
jgi:hypothetical protein